MSELDRIARREFDIDPDLEAELRAELHAVAVPSAAPDHVHDRIEWIAEREIARGRGPIFFPSWRRVAVGVASVAAVLLVVAIAGLGLVWRGNGGPAGVTPLPSRTGWVKPGPAPTGTPVGGIGWSSDGSTMIASVGSDPNGAIRMSSDGGTTWSESRYLPAPSDLGLDFVDAEHGFTAWEAPLGNATVLTAYRTTDGGKTWQSATVATLPVPAGRTPLAEIHFADAMRGVVTTAFTFDGPESPATGIVAPFIDCRVYSTSDGGVSWTGPTARPCSWFVMWADPTAGFIVDAPRVSVTEDLGASWRTATLPDLPAGDTFNIRVYQHLGPGHLRLAGVPIPVSSWTGNLPFLVYETTDGGATWRQTYRSGGDFDAIALQGISPISADHWFALREDRTTAPFEFSRLTQTWDAGRTWADIDVQSVEYNGNTYGVGQDSGFTSGGLISFLDDRHGAVQGGFAYCPGTGGSCGSDGAWFVTDDGGHTWREARVP